jgi:Protein of unknown function (DUF3455)
MMKNLWSLGTLLICPFVTQAAEPGGGQVPDTIKAPAGEVIVLRAHATGFQVYTCGKSDSGQSQWTLKAPDAVLHDRKGRTIGTHFAGPTWKHSDGSEVAGKVVSRADAPEKAAIPWLLLSATSHSGQGVLSDVSSIQRLHTKGGQAPAADSCSTANQGAESKVRYSADYYFYAPSKH